VASLELSLPAIWTAARLKPLRYEAGDALSADVARRLQPSVENLARWMSAAPAGLAGLGDRKGRIAPGYDADLVVWDPDAAFTVDAARLQQRHKLTPYAGRRLSGVVHATFLRGERIWDGDHLTIAESGHLL